MFWLNYTDKLKFDFTSAIIIINTINIIYIFGHILFWSPSVGIESTNIEAILLTDNFEWIL